MKCEMKTMLQPSSRRRRSAACCSPWQRSRSPPSVASRACPQPKRRFAPRWPGPLFAVAGVTLLTRRPGGVRLAVPLVVNEYKDGKFETLFVGQVD